MHHGRAQVITLSLRTTAQAGDAAVLLSVTESERSRAVTSVQSREGKPDGRKPTFSGNRKWQYFLEGLTKASPTQGKKEHGTIPTPFRTGPPFLFTPGIHILRDALHYKDKAVHVQAMKAYVMNGGIPPCINLGTRWRWVVSFTTQPFWPGKWPLVAIK